MRLHWLLPVLLVALDASATQVDASALTLLNARPELVDGEAVTSFATLEFLQLRARGMDKGFAKDLGVLLSLWGSLEPVGPSADQLIDGDVNLAFVEGKVLREKLTLRLGRQLIVSGVTRSSLIDGLTADYESRLGLGASASFGMPVTPRFSRVSFGQWELAARMSYSPWPMRLVVGASFDHVAEQGEVLRQEAGFDGRWRVVPGLVLAGAASLSTRDARFSEIDFGPQLRLGQSIELDAGYRRTAPNLLLPRNSILSVFSDSTRDELGATLVVTPLEWLSVFADGRMLKFESEGEDESGLEATVRTVLRPFRKSPTSLTAQLRYLKEPTNGFFLGRLGATHELGLGVSAAADFEVYQLQHEINGVRLSLAGSASLLYAFARDWQLGVTFFESTTPFYESRHELIAKLTYVLPSWRSP